MIDYRRIPVHGDLRVSKKLLPRLPYGFVEVPDHLGNKKNALRQYRGPHNIHVLEYADEWSFHRDLVDPRIDPVGHLLLDAPEVPLAGLAGIAVAKKAYDENESVLDSVIAGGLAGLFTWVALSELKQLARHLR